MKKFAIAALVAALSCFAGTSQAAVPEVPFGPDFQVAGISVTSGGTIIVYAGVREFKGKTAVCGAVWFEDATGTTRSLERQFTEQVGFTLAGKPLSVSTGVFVRYKSLEDAETGGKARCSVTRRA